MPADRSHALVPPAWSLTWSYPPPEWMFALASGILLGLAFPAHPDSLMAPLHHPAWAWIALTPLLAALTQCNSNSAFRLGWIAGASFALHTLYWVAGTEGGGMAVVGGTGLLAAYLGLFLGLFAGAQRLLLVRLGRRSLLLAPVLWTAQEYLVSVGELGFPWLLLGHSQAAIPSLIQYATITGAYGVSFWAVLLNVLVLQVLRSPSLRRVNLFQAGALVAAFAAPIAYATRVIPAAGSAEATARVAVIQPNLSLADKWGNGGLEFSLERLEQLSRDAAAAAPDLDLLVWPETAVPCYLGLRSQCQGRIQTLADQLGVPVLTGAPDYDRARREPYNAAFLLQPGQSEMQRYAKMHLVPFGERTPFRDRIPLLRNINWSALTGDLGPAEFASGAERTVFAHPRVPFVVLICFEAVFPDFARRSVQQGGRLIVNITNDSWFGDSAGPYQHAELAAMRAVENRTPMARCASTGISMFIDAYGRVSGATGLGEQTYRVHDVAAASGGTFYTRHGDWFALLMLICASLLVLYARIRPPLAEETMP
jgi:apolipoprotein N-acyltransferase